ncbi:hypothetical protein HRbin27_00753 [bacterium HR27]|nr:hypothetical protein HRbin27_00753 [bacterium HR27]
MPDRQVDRVTARPVVATLAELPIRVRNKPRRFGEFGETRFGTETEAAGHLWKEIRVTFVELGTDLEEDRIAGLHQRVVQRQAPLPLRVPVAPHHGTPWQRECRWAVEGTLRVEAEIFHPGCHRHDLERRTGRIADLRRPIEQRSALLVVERLPLLGTQPEDEAIGVETGTAYQGTNRPVPRIDRHDASDAIAERLVGGLLQIRIDRRHDIGSWFRRNLGENASLAPIWADDDQPPAAPPTQELLRPGLDPGTPDAIAWLITFARTLLEFLCRDFGKIAGHVGCGRAERIHPLGPLPDDDTGDACQLLKQGRIDRVGQRRDRHEPVRLAVGVALADRLLRKVQELAQPLEQLLLVLDLARDHPDFVHEPQFGERPPIPVEDTTTLRDGRDPLHATIAEVSDDQ